MVRERRWFRREREGGGKGWGHSGRGRGWNSFGRFRGFSGSSAGSLGQIYGYIERREKARARGALTVIYTVIRVHNANFNLSRRCHCHHPSSLFDARLFLERAAPSTRETGEWKDDEVKAKKREGGTGWSERREWKGYKATATSRRPSRL